MSHRLTLAVATLLAISLAISMAGHAAYPGPRDPDWPCQQIKVPHLSAGAIWNGPPLDPYMQTWSQDAAVATLVHRLAQRRIPVEQAQAEIMAFAQHAGAERRPRLTMLMAGLFDTLGQERDGVMEGLDRYGRRQRQFADELRADNAALRSLQAASNTDPARLEQAANQLTLELRVFEDRQQSVSYACNVPTTIEQRLFALSRAIQQALGS